MAKKVLAALDVYVATHKPAVQRKSDCAEIIGITGANVYAFFAGNRSLDISVLEKIAAFTGISLDDVKAEYRENVDNCMKGNGL